MNEVLSDEAMWSLVVAFFSPPVLSLIIQTTWSSRVKAAVAFVWALVVGFVTAWLTGALSGRSLVTTILIVLVGAIAFYEGFWKPTGVSPIIEQKTSKRT